MHVRYLDASIGLALALPKSKPDSRSYQLGMAGTSNASANRLLGRPSTGACRRLQETLGGPDVVRGVVP